MGYRIKHGVLLSGKIFSRTETTSSLIFQLEEMFNLYLYHEQTIFFVVVGGMVQFNTINPFSLGREDCFHNYGSFR